MGTRRHTGDARAAYPVGYPFDSMSWVRSSFWFEVNQPLRARTSTCSSRHSTAGGLGWGERQSGHEERGCLAGSNGGGCPIDATNLHRSPPFPRVFPVPTEHRGGGAS